MQTKYLLLKPSMLAGIGDSILALIQAVSYAKLSGRTLCIDWTGGMYGMPDDQNFFHRIFKVNNIPIIEEIPKGLSVYPTVWEKYLDKTFEQLKRDDNFLERHFAPAVKKYSFDVSKFDYQEDILVMWDFHQFDKLIDPLIEKGIINNSHSEYYAMGKVFEKFISLAPEPAYYIEKNWDKIVGDSINAKIVGVHIRDTKESMNSFGYIPRIRYSQSVDSLVEEIRGNILIYLATDNISAQREFITKYGNKVISKSKWFKKPGKPIHLSLKNCPDKWRNILDAIFDMFALSRCDYLVRRKQSSFSTASQVIGLFKNENVVIQFKEMTNKQKIRYQLSKAKNVFLKVLKN